MKYTVAVKSLKFVMSFHRLDMVNGWNSGTFLVVGVRHYAWNSNGREICSNNENFNDTRIPRRERKKKQSFRYDQFGLTRLNYKNDVE